MKIRVFKKRLRRTKANLNVYEMARAWERVTDLIIKAKLQKWPEPVFDCLLELDRILLPAFRQRLQMLRRYGIKEK